ncbi:DNA-binding transcriptional regulator Fis [Ectothiorhodospiraceae bacterium WFHF3C12]|nr:DNA-binding transcriptional regulator Fis [Ectothiorhodospiraceae bacterium WFHF3C12]
MESRAIAAQSDRSGSAQPSESESAGVGPIQACVRETLVDYFARLNGYECLDLYRMVLEEVELPLLQVVMAESGGNQSKAARMLGINRGTLRKKLRQYGLED